MEVRRPWKKIIGPWLIVLGWLLFFWYIEIKIPPSTFISPIFIASLVVWLLMGRFSGWGLNSISHVRPRRIPRLYWGLFGTLGLLEAWLGLTLGGPFFDLGVGFVGWPLGSAITFSYLLVREMRLKYCERCKTNKYFVKYRGNWYCGVCGKKHAAAEETNPTISESSPKVITAKGLIYKIHRPRYLQPRRLGS